MITPSAQNIYFTINNKTTCSNIADYYYSDNQNCVNTEWIHVAVVVDAISITMYLNGLQKHRETYHTPITFTQANSKDLTFGRLGNNCGVGADFWFPFNGRLDDIVYYNRALSQAEINQLYNYPSPYASSPMLANTKTINDNVNFGSVYERNGFSFPAQTQCGTFSHSRTNGCDSTYYFNLTVLPTLALSSAKRDTVCSGTARTYTATCATANTTFTWTRAAVTDISNPAKSGSTATVTDTLINTSTSPVTVLYVFTLTANGCSKNDTLTRIVNPAPKLSSPKSDMVCSGEARTYTATCATANTTFSWTRAAEAYITPTTASGNTDTIKETLISTSTAPVTVRYIFTLTTANGCSKKDTLIRVVRPTPRLSSAKRDTVCSGEAKTYTATCAVAGRTYSWTRDSIAGITPARASGNTATINETLTSTSTSPVAVNYVFTLTAYSCTNNDTFVRVVNPKPSFTSPDTCVESICSGFAATYYPTSDPSSATYTWTRAEVEGITEPAGSGSGDINEVLTNTTSDPITVTYVVTATVNGCTNTKNVTVVVKPKKTPSITIKVKTD
jgi:hypothetical protein